MNKIILDNEQRQEINKMIDILNNHLKEYSVFKSFIKLAKDALSVANALLNSDIKTFKKYALKYSNHNAEKMRGIKSLSTYKKTSDICNYMQLNADKNSICKYCYADKSISLYKASLTPTLIYNTLLLKYIDLSADQIPYINDKYFRFESFSDLQNAKHFKNLITICKKNKNTIFTLWSKAGLKIKLYMEQEKIKKLPSNLNIVYSEYRINKKSDSKYINLLQSVFNQSNKIKVFCVFNDEKLRANSDMYLCKNKCIDCLKCYKKSKNIIYIAEKLH